MYALLLRLMFLLPPERIHHLAFGRDEVRRLVPPARLITAKLLVTDDPILRNTAFGIDFPAPLGLAAGFDKDARVWMPGPHWVSDSPRSAPSPRGRSRAIRRRGCSGCPPTGR